MVTCSACRRENPDTALRCLGCGGLLRITRTMERARAATREIAQLAKPVSAESTADAPSAAPAPSAPPAPSAESGPAGANPPTDPLPVAAPLPRRAPPPPVPARPTTRTLRPGSDVMRRPTERGPVERVPTQRMNRPQRQLPPPPSAPGAGGARPAGAPRRAPPPIGWLRCHPLTPLALVPGAVITVGRTGESDLTLPHPTVSRTQAVLRVGPEGVELEDRSSHGTFVNGQPVQGKRALVMGDVIGMGAYELTLSRDLPEPGEDTAETTRSLEALPLAEPGTDALPAPAITGPDRRANVFYGHYGTDSNLLGDLSQATDEAVVSGRPLPDDAPRTVRGASGRDYVLQRELGRGAFGAVYLAEIPGGARLPGFAQPVETAVVKLASAAPSAQESLAREREVYATPDPGLVNLFDHGLTPAEGGRPFLVLERLWPHPFSRNGGQAVDPATAVDTFVNLLEVLNRLHTRREASLVLCDIKPDNLMIRLSNKQGAIHAPEYARRVRGRAYEPVFMDMGCAQDRVTLGATGGKLKDVVGTPIYLPPETIPRPDEARGFRPGVYSEKVDVFALTLTFYQLLTGDRPYSATGIWELKGEPLLLAILELKQQRGISPHRTELLRQRFSPADAQALEELLEAGLQPSPELRLGARDLLRLARRLFSVAETRVLSLSEYHFDAVQGIQLEQRRFPQGSGL